MSVLFLTLAAIFVTAPLLSSHSYQLVWETERAQIAVDNAAIEMGRADRELLNELVQVNRQLEIVEVSHHVAHRCAQTPSPAQPGCEATDRALEATIMTWRAIAYQRAQLLWRASELRALAAAGALEHPIRISHRPAMPPLRSVRCSQCQMDIYWEIEGAARREFSFETLKLPSQKAELEWDGENLRQRTRWNYRLRPVCDDGAHR